MICFAIDLYSQYSTKLKMSCVPNNIFNNHRTFILQYIMPELVSVVSSNLQNGGGEGGGGGGGGGGREERERERERERGIIDSATISFANVSPFHHC